MKIEYCLDVFESLKRELRVEDKMPFGILFNSQFSISYLPCEDRIFLHDTVHLLTNGADSLIAFGSGQYGVDQFHDLAHKRLFSATGGIVCPIRWDKEHKILLEDIVKALNLNTLVIADAGLGTINAVVLTIEYIRNHGMGVKGVILNHYVGGIMQEDNARMIEELTGIPVIAKVKDGDGELAIDIEKLKKIYN